MKIIKTHIIVMILLPFVLSACSNSARQNINSNGQAVDKTTLMLNTIITSKAYGKKAGEALDLAFERVHEIENKMSRYQSGSEVYAINQNVGKTPTSISPDTYFVIDTALQYAKQTNGAFNPLIGKIIDLWGIGTDHAKIPSADELNAYLPYLDYRKLQLNKDTQTAMLTSNNVELDLGAIAKGYAADEMKRVLQEQGITSAFLNLGGNVLVMGTKPNGDLWTIGIQNPLKDQRGELVATIKVKDTSVVTSGSYERYFEKNGKKYHHIIDPSTGYPANNGVISSTIITPRSIDADALSTSVYVLGKEKGLALIESLPDVEAIIITEDLHIYTTSGIDQDMFTVRSKEFIYEKSR